MNKVILIGRLTKDPDLRFAASTGNAVTRFSIAVTRQFNRDEVDFINCVSFGKSAETMAQYLSKGSRISIVGNIRTGSYDAQDGSKRYSTDIVVENFEFLSSSKGSSELDVDDPMEEPTNHTKSSETNVKSEESVDFSDDMTPVDDEDIPF